jgi:hypothetical protein
MTATIAPPPVSDPQDITHHAAALMQWHGLSEADIPSVTDALNAWDLPELKVTEPGVRAAFASLGDVTIRAASS